MGYSRTHSIYLIFLFNVEAGGCIRTPKPVARNDVQLSTVGL